MVKWVGDTVNWVTTGRVTNDVAADLSVTH